MNNKINIVSIIRYLRKMNVDTIEIIKPYVTLYETSKCVITLVKQYFILNSCFPNCKLSEHNCMLYVTKCGNPTKKMLYDEYKILMKIRDINIVNALGYSSSTNTLTLEYIPGCNLISFINEDMVNENNFDNIAKQMIRSIAIVHSAGYLHRDIKPDNYMINDSNIIKLIDFEFSVKIGKPCNLSGSREYVAPEIVNDCLDRSRESNNFTEKSDIWSLGVTLFCTKYGKSPFSGNNVMETFNNILNFELPYEDSDFGRLLEGMLRKDPHKRFDMNNIINSQFYLNN